MKSAILSGPGFCAVCPDRHSALTCITARLAQLAPLAIPATLVMAAAVILSFAALVSAFLASDFSVALVASHSHSAKPWIYKFSGTWGNHEGSSPLDCHSGIVCRPSGDGWARHGNRPQDWDTCRAGADQCRLPCLCLFTSNPFARLDPPPVDGRGLNPILQDPGLALRPPTLYLGYVGLSMAFSFAVAGLIEGRIDRDWARHMRPWVTTAWCALTAGIALGSWWAYYELGWGGWWFWDPVENASLMPWLAATALLHSTIVVEQRGALKSWTVLLAILAFRAIACRHLHCALGPADIGSQFCQRPGPWCFHSRHFAGCGRHTTIAVCHSRSADHKPQRFALISREGA